jgi:hypothetical protein
VQQLFADWAGLTMEMEEVAGGGAAGRDTADAGVDVISAHHLQTLNATKVLEMSAEAAVAGKFHHG